MSKTKIEWCDHTINPIVGCSKCSPGCDNCYAEKMAWRLSKNPLTAQKYAGVVDERGWTGKIRYSTTNAHRNDDPHRVPGENKRVFIGSMTDMFHLNTAQDALDEVFASILADAIFTNGHGHKFIMVTKRVDRMLEYFAPGPDALLRRWCAAGNGWIHTDDPDISFSDYAEGQTIPQPDHEKHPLLRHEYLWPLPNFWALATICNQPEADEKIPLLLQVPAAKRGVSIEPMLGPVDIGKYLYGCYECGLSCGTRMACNESPEMQCTKCGFTGPDDYETWGDGDCAECPECKQDGCCGEIEAICPDCGHYMVQYHPDTPCIDWVICGGETGPNARPMHPDWVRSLCDQCGRDHVKTPFFFKQWGEWLPLSACPEDFDKSAYPWTGVAIRPQTPDAEEVYRVGKRRAGRLLDGVEWNEFPEARP